MSLGGIFTKVLGIGATIAGVATGNPALAIGGLSQLAGGGGGGASSIPYGGTPADASKYINIRIPGFNYPEQDMPLVDMPTYPDSLSFMNMPQYGKAPLLPDPTMMGPTAGETAGMRSASDAEQILKAIRDPYSQESQRLSADEEQASREDFLRSMRDIMSTNRRSKAMGRGSLFDPERGGEMLMDAVTRNASESKASARNNALSRLSAVFTGLQQNAGTYKSLAQLETGRRDALRGDIMNRVNQERADYATNNAQAREDATSRQNLVKDKINQQRDDIVNALNLYRNQRADLSAGRADINSRQAGLNASMVQGGIPVANQIVGAANYGIGALQQGSLNPWMNPDTGSYYSSWL